MSMSVSQSLALGDTQETVVATLSAIGTDRLSSVAVLKFVDRFAQEAMKRKIRLLLKQLEEAKGTKTKAKENKELLRDVDV